jgi:hypothetical protein
MSPGYQTALRRSARERETLERKNTAIENAYQIKLSECRERGKENLRPFQIG